MYLSPVNKNMDLGHWNFAHEFNPEDWFGFVYRITNLVTGQQYVGKKQFYKINRKKVKGRKNRKVVKSESDWKDYMGSSNALLSDIEAHGKENFTFEIESLHKTKASLYYEEVRVQIFEDVLRSKLNDGVTPKYYNRQIGSVKFIPPDPLPEEEKMRILRG